ncbi:GWT1-domain-containing protein [Fomitiporia mediterranea MF3/22]|uniref:GWT1-domain-containing protein n=1 Tax=Fomitiporia mediterranea (strain MF3/22) TaxID=694068 RepID=UPI000440728C|nr:GWT1-domain-containing protein [Fomitiporia mediterranea MF3/22]EJD01801.1 GWT1-domain-containing protein [Fomitiporia mediterranea MF3/22]
MADYKASKEAFVSDGTGSSITHVNLVSAVALCSIALHTALQSHLSSLNLLLEWTVLVLPLLLSMTLFADFPLLLSFILLVPTVLLFFRSSRQDDEPPLSPLSISRAPSPLHSSSFPPQQVSSSQSSDESIPIAPLPALTVYRAHMMLMTILAILAVDFPVFPRSLAKCETFGVSLMDLGVGSFVFSQGVVSAIPLLKQPPCLLAPAVPKILYVSKKVLPLFVLGIVRVISVKGTEYPEHESEYGTHWNFFFTMALLPVLEVLLHPVIILLPISLLGFLVALSHQLTLSLTPLQNFALHASRTNLISGNKEGLVSLTGYLAIHLLGLSVGTLLLPPSPSEFRQQQHKLRLQLRGSTSPVSPSKASQRKDETKERTKTWKRQDDKTVLELFSYALLWWTVLGVCYLTDIGGGVSRRLANLPYVIWIAAFNTSFIMFYLLLDKLRPSTSQSNHISRNTLHPTSSAHDSYFPSDDMKSSRKAPALLEAINRNGLALFLLANVLTGLINLSMSSMYASNMVSMVVLSLYSFGMCSVAWDVHQIPITNRCVRLALKA